METIIVSMMEIAGIDKIKPQDHLFNVTKNHKILVNLSLNLFNFLKNPKIHQYSISTKISMDKYKTLLLIPME
jgi:hypothetical protein